jgi:hypothetical protein
MKNIDIPLTRAQTFYTIMDFFYYIQSNGIAFTLYLVCRFSQILLNNCIKTERIDIEIGTVIYSHRNPHFHHV